MFSSVLHNFKNNSRSLFITAEPKRSHLFFSNRCSKDPCDKNSLRVNHQIGKIPTTLAGGIPLSNSEKVNATLYSLISAGVLTTALLLLYQSNKVDDDLTSKAILTAAKVDYTDKPWADEQLLQIDPEVLSEKDQGFAGLLVKRYSAEELEQKKLIVRDGILYLKNSETPMQSVYFMTDRYDGPEIFNYVMFGDGTIVIDRPEHQSPFFRSYHSSLTTMEKPIAAGEIIFSNGQVESLNEKSGHFKPKNRVQYVEQQFRSLGVQFASNYSLSTYTELDIDNWGAHHV